MLEELLLEELVLDELLLDEKLTLEDEVLVAAELELIATDELDSEDAERLLVETALLLAVTSSAEPPQP